MTESKVHMRHAWGRKYGTACGRNSLFVTGAPERVTCRLCQRTETYIRAEGERRG